MKTIRFWYKIWYTKILIGYLFDFTIYEGSISHKTDNINNFGLGAVLVLDIIDGLSVSFVNIFRYYVISFPMTSKLIDFSLMFL